jgi:hypothetical protein
MSTPAASVVRVNRFKLRVGLAVDGANLSCTAALADPGAAG